MSHGVMTGHKSIAGQSIPDPDFRADLKVNHTRPVEFDETAYLAVYDDVTVSLDTGEFATARDHFEHHGRREGRLTDENYIRALGLAPAAPEGDDAVSFSIDTVMGTRGGTVLIVGWIDDRDIPLDSVSIFVEREQAWNTTAFGRVRRRDVEAMLGTASAHLFGFWIVAKLGAGLSASRPWAIRGRLANGRFGQGDANAAIVSDATLRTAILGYFAETEYFGNRDIESFLSLEAGIGSELVILNREITTSIVAGAWVSYHGPERKHYDGSIVVCLYGKHEFLFLQSALFSVGVDSKNHEFVFVSNSPELTEVLQKEARICARIYDVSIVLVCLHGNAGFGAANNAAARFARSKRLMITNPDVFPRDDKWARRHSDIIASAPGEQTLMFGAPLYYDDGSLMHHGMYFEIDTGTSVRPDRIYTRPMIRTEHYGKGAPSWSTQFLCPRPVPAITGAFMSCDRGWFEALGGFNEDFLFGHYEDADLSLRSLSRGRPVWMQDFPLWHMEGKGSTRRAEHEGGSLVNRWLFTRLWGDYIAAELQGSRPSCSALRLGLHHESR